MFDQGNARTPSRNAKPARRNQRDDGGIQSIVRAFALLETVARASNGVGLSDLARSVGLHSSTVFNLVRTMVSLGYLWQSPDDKRYRLGRPLFCLAATALDELWLVDRARAALEDLSRSSGETGHFAVWASDQVVVLAKSSGAGAFQLTDRAGTRPAHATALGKVLLSALPPPALEDFLAHANLVRFTARTITDPRRLRDDVARVREGALALDDAEFHEDVRCIAVAVRDFSGRTVGAIGLSGPVWRMSDDAVRGRASMLAAAAQRLSAELGSGGLSDAYSPAVARVAAPAPVAATGGKARAAKPAVGTGKRSPGKSAVGTGKRSPGKSAVGARKRSPAKPASALRKTGKTAVATSRRK